MRLVGTYFDLTDRFAPNPAGEARPVLKVIGDGKEPEGVKGGKVVISVAKRLVPSAVRRNTVKRIVREAWRAASGQASESTRQGAQDNSARSTHPGLPAGRVATGPSRVCLVRLKRYPGKDLKAVKRKSVKGKPVKGSPADGSPVNGIPMNAPGLTAIKRSLRSDADQLFAAFLSGRTGHRRSSGRKSV